MLVSSLSLEYNLMEFWGVTRYYRESQAFRLKRKFKELNKSMDLEKRTCIPLDDIKKTRAKHKRTLCGSGRYIGGMRVSTCKLPVPSQTTARTTGPQLRSSSTLQIGIGIRW
ncbi:hypothetical protein HAX54_038398 [Datura stramonium]|uniref:Uncharacterized protein n=1 Tax=Datura stramonium TaxID=4076 RepID=A0ABS8VN43_DATST|nr:hypothetical protein [Datura stramonium]